MMPTVGFTSPRDGRWRSTFQAIEQDLVSGSLVYRYSHDPQLEGVDGVDGAEGTFSMCSFWYAQCPAQQGHLDKAPFYFEKMLGYANHLGLSSEDLGRMGEHRGNFPQAFIHLALVGAALNLDRTLSRAGHRG